jgi:hypothetical protein
MARNPAPSMPEPSALAQIEAGCALLRGAGAVVLAGHAAATLPFLALVAFWWADATSAAMTAGRAAFWVGALLAGFVLMRAGQAWFMARLWNHCHGAQSAPWGVARWARVLGRCAVVQPSIFLMLPLATLLGLTGPGGFAFFQTDTLQAGLARESVPDALRRSLRLSVPWIGSLASTHALLFVAALLLQANLIVLTLLVLALLDSLAGLQLLQGLTWQHLLNTTTWFLLLLPTYLCVDPLLRACTVWRVFLLDSRSDGSDLRVALRAGTIARAAAPAVVLLAVLTFPSHRLRAEERAEPPPAVSETAPAPEDSAALRMERDLERVLQRSEFRWRLPPDPAAAADQDGFWARIGRWVDEQLEGMRSLVRKLRRFLGEGKSVNAPDPTPLMALTDLSIKLAAVILGGVLVFLIVRTLLRLRSRGAQRMAMAAAAPVQAATRADLEREETHASDRPGDEWARLAAELAAKGEWRLALRAWHLSGLARLGEAGMLALKRSKSDRDYERELRRRSQPALAARFSEQREAYERRWYGRVPADEPTVRRFSEPWSLP